MKKNGSKKLIFGIASLAFLCGGLVTYAGTELTWGGEDDTSKISVILDNLKSDILNKKDKLNNNTKELIALKSESDDLKKQIKDKSEEIDAMDSIRSELEANINELNNQLDEQHQLTLEREGYYNDTMAQMDEDFEAKISELQSKISQSKFEKEVLEVSIQKLNGEKDALQSKYQDAVDDNLAADSELGKAREDIKNLREKAEQTIQDVQN